MGCRKCILCGIRDGEFWGGRWAFVKRFFPGPFFLRSALFQFPQKDPLLTKEWEEKPLSGVGLHWWHWITKTLLSSSCGMPDLTGKSVIWVCNVDCLWGHGKRLVLWDSKCSLSLQRLCAEGIPLKLKHPTPVHPLRSGGPIWFEVGWLWHVQPHLHQKNSLHPSLLLPLAICGCCILVWVGAVALHLHRGSQIGTSL